MGRHINRKHTLEYKTEINTQNLQPLIREILVSMAYISDTLKDSADETASKVAANRLKALKNISDILLALDNKKVPSYESMLNKFLESLGKAFNTLAVDALTRQKIFLELKRELMEFDPTDEVVSTIVEE